MRAFGLSWTMVLWSMQWPQSLLKLTLGHWSVEQPGWWYFECEWLWQTISLTLGICFYKGFKWKGCGLWWRSSGPGHSRSNWLWFLGASHFGLPPLNWIINVIKESKIDEFSISLNRLRISHLLACHWAELSIKSETAANQTMDLTNLNEAVKLIKKEEIDAFSSKIIYAQPKTMYLGSNLHMMTQVLEEGNGSHLPHWLSIMNTFIEMARGSRQVAVEVKNMSAALITITKGVKITWV